ncbi:UNKNOWN [Stylonychia lemnae]|uniref:Uncharacterized protein n=1 Tax=Stylonychia lemnae TaxID=5949 RepID=A0A078AI25_STYLE|nr:UNKNOWN [Stylonychia lemnae]|eukprot:CDW81167.1 UNKNOWN [Stylonychia lemnae]
MGSEKRNTFGSVIQSSIAPGPGLYDANRGLSFIKGKMSPNITMGQKFNASSINDPSYLPGPGQYDISDEKEKRSKSYSIGLKYQRNLIGAKEGPGPGTYNIDKADKSRSSGGVGSSVGASFSFPKDDRNITRDIEKKSKDIPDPTAYDPALRNSQIGISLGQKISMESNYKMITPGPGTYNVQSNFKNNRYSGKDSKLSHIESVRSGQSQQGPRQTLQTNNYPGPGQYMQSMDSSIFKNQKGTTFGNATRTDLTPKDVQSTPGPNSYLPNINLIKKSAANWQIKQLFKNNSHTSRNLNPGPGTYDALTSKLSDMRSGPSISMGLKYEIQKDPTRGNPSPLDYAPNYDPVNKKSTGVKIGKQAQRISLAEKSQLESPPPDQYFQSIELSDAMNKLKGKSSGPKWTMGTSQRYEIGGSQAKTGKNQPGPGNYELPPTIGNIPHYERSKIKTLQ